MTIFSRIQEFRSFSVLVIVLVIVLLGSVVIYEHASPARKKDVKISPAEKTLSSWESPRPKIEAYQNNQPSSILLFENSPFVDTNCDDYFMENRVSCCTDPSVPVLAGLDVVKIRHFPGAISWGKSEYKTSITTNNGIYNFYFESGANKYLFDENPTWYLPSYGGFAADKIEDFGSSEAFTTLGPRTNLRSSAYVDGKLLFFSDKQHISSIEMKDIQRTASESWRKLFEGHEDTIYNTQCVFLPVLQIDAEIDGDLLELIQSKSPESELTTREEMRKHSEKEKDKEIRYALRPLSRNSIEPENLSGEVFLTTEQPEVQIKKTHSR